VEFYSKRPDIRGKRPYGHETKLKFIVAEELLTRKNEGRDKMLLIHNILQTDEGEKGQDNYKIPKKRSAHFAEDNEGGTKEPRKIEEENEGGTKEPRKIKRKDLGDSAKKSCWVSAQNIEECIQILKQHYSNVVNLKGAVCGNVRSQV